MANIKEAGHFTLTFTFDDQDPELRFFNGTFDGTNQNLHIGAQSNTGDDNANNIHHSYYDIDWTNESNLANYYITQPNVSDTSKYNDDRDFLRKDYSTYKHGLNEFKDEKDNFNTDVEILNSKEHVDHRLTTDLIDGYSKIEDINPGTGTYQNRNLLGEHFNRKAPSKNNKSFINELSPYLIAVRKPENPGNEYYLDKNSETEGYGFAWLNGATMWTFPTSSEHGEGVDVTKHVFYRSDHPQQIDKNRVRTYSYSDWQWGSENINSDKTNGKNINSLNRNARVTWLGSADAPKYDSSLPDKPVTIEQISRTDATVGTNPITPSNQHGLYHRRGVTDTWTDTPLSYNTGLGNSKESWGNRKANITVSFNSKTVSNNYARITPTETTISNLKVTVFIHYFRRHDYSPLEYDNFEKKTVNERGVSAADDGTKHKKTGTNDVANSSWSGNTNTLIKSYRFRSIARFIELGTVPFTHMAQSLMSTNGKILLKEIIKSKNNVSTGSLSIESDAYYKKGVSVGPKVPTEKEIESEVLLHANKFGSNYQTKINANNAFNGDSEQLILEPKDSHEKWIIQSHDVCNETTGKRYNRLYFKYDEDGIFPRYPIHSQEPLGNEQSVRATQTRGDIPYGTVAYIRADPSSSGDGDTNMNSVGIDKGASSVNALLNFTGQHRALSDLVDENPEIGYIVVSNGKISSYTSKGNKIKGKNAITINESVPEVEYSQEYAQKTVFGVIAGVEDQSNIREYSSGSIVTVYNKSTKDRRLIVNSLGEGGIWVCNSKGNLNNGDFITTSDVEGIGCKQDDDIIHTYTVAKITIDCSFTLGSPAYNCQEFDNNGAKLRKAFVSCTYHSG